MSPPLAAVVLPAALAALAAAVALQPRSAARRLAQVVPPGVVRPRRRSRQGAVSTAGASGATLACALAGTALALLLGGPVGVGLGLLLAAGGPAVLGRLEPASTREEREALAADLPLALDLLAACLTGGAALPEAVRAVADAVPGPCGARLLRVAAALEVGRSPGEAWSVLALPGDELAGAAARALARAGEGGAPVAGAVVRLAEQAREGARARGQQAAERAGVLAVGPLGLCFLPAFVLLGVVPVVAGLVGPLLAGL